ncbi:hypothetical protein B4129_2686 [Bacillus safensis]|nr:hypothetical protein B4129_2686 [Bacillus safensis]
MMKQSLKRFLHDLLSLPLLLDAGMLSFSPMVINLLFP